MLNLNKNEKYIIGLSGGPDSIFLLLNLAKKVNPKNILACHVNYNFRDDSYVDQQICIEICQQLNIELELKIIELDYKLLNDNFESWARKIRYDFFWEVARKKDIKNLLIAHNLNDHIETFLMQQDKINNLVSYYGINQISNYKDLVVLRPILEYKKSQILDWLDKNNIKYANDSTNFDLKYKRNQIRKLINENDFEKYIKQIKIKNQQLSKDLEIVNNIVFENNWLNIKELKYDVNLNQRIIFKFLEINNVVEKLCNNKKSRIKELLKICNSKKSYIEFKTKDIFIVKDYNYLKVIDKTDLDVYYYLPNDREFEKILKYYQIECDNKSELIITNDWKKWKKELLFKGKRLEKIYLDKKISYILRYQTFLIFNKTKKNIINNII